MFVQWNILKNLTFSIDIMVLLSVFDKPVFIYKFNTKTHLSKEMKNDAFTNACILLYVIVNIFIEFSMSLSCVCIVFNLSMK